MSQHHCSTVEVLNGIRLMGNKAGFLPLLMLSNGVQYQGNARLTMAPSDSSLTAHDIITVLVWLHTYGY